MANNGTGGMVNSGTVGEYNASTGTPINPNFITGLSGPPGALAVSGNTLFVANNTLSGTVSAYNVSTNPATLINPNFITGLGFFTTGLAVSGNTLFVANSGTVSAYNVSTNPATLINPNFITGLGPAGALAVSGNTLFVANTTSNGTVLSERVGEYDATTGTAIKANLITGLNTLPTGLAVASGPGSNVPIANAGPNQTVHAGTLVTMDGSASSDPSGQLPLTYAWSFVSEPAGSAVTLSDPTIVNPTFTPDAVGNYVILLIVTDAAGLSSAPATVTISTTDAPPVADAGPDQVITAIGTLVQLNGSGSYDLAGFPITYQWSFVSKPAGSNATLTGPTTATPSFVVDVAGNYSIQLVVTDSLGTASSPAVVNVSFNDVAPVANAGPSQSAVVGETVKLNGSGSTDSDGEPLTYMWSVVSAPSGSTAAILNPTAQIASLVPDRPSTFVVQLIVNDGMLNSLPATTEIVAVSQQTSLTQQIRSLQGVIAKLPPSAFKHPRLQDDLLKKLNAVIVSIMAHEYRHALRQLRDDILTNLRSMGAPLPGPLTGMTGSLTVQTRAWSIRLFSTLSRRLRPYAEGNGTC